ncbi:hypothetical protein [Polynucleobacter necessarius]|uniref:hypothetical protein n=1 Tax=Polynucleobacter necessarius TaxID=576610 RepID=UPI000E093D66|nr:hypothetical protein [Polynucleobacter necessarius]HAT39843.1 hypothetical protein [Polynucleobacter sp.]
MNCSTFKKSKSALSILLVASAGIGVNQPVEFAPNPPSTVSVSNLNNQLDPIIVTATRTPTRANDVLADYVYIGPEEMADAGPSTITDLL